MVDFIAAFNKGLDAAQIAEKNKREINSVFDELNKQLANATKGNVNIQIRECEKAPDFNPLGGSRIDFRNIKYQAICAINPLFPFPVSPTKEIATWSQDRTGYPCKISFGTKEHYCEDKVALENALALMLQDPIVGENLAELMAMSKASA
ncbi:hypothetical protein [Methylovulum psychrotolerans]|uniref:Uncharacterized protein n=1 Tax=Methylovulum psychrotolerans TaxID=1704499 RepID=A0A1Z4BXR2_9GAMM|nr:hypothetical protein [Methylovulum psychrotolerans]ASF46086.1 hypothetical protein CEK71_08325 [Methylovulum psychrotolerans]POZ51832.1 hypothetical protein AADEFJLK_02049 [Methylovulum psychrotolerans]